jgi:hypothetical protein
MKRETNSLSPRLDVLPYTAFDTLDIYHNHDSAEKGAPGIGNTYFSRTVGFVFAKRNTLSKESLRCGHLRHVTPFQGMFALS